MVVGASDSLTGLRALREGVAAARQRGLVLHVVRAYPGPGAEAYAGPAGSPGLPTHSADVAPAWPRVQREGAARAMVEHAFAMALGGLPRDVEVNIYTRQGAPHRVLVDVAYDEHDLLIVGTTRRRRWWPFGRRLSHYVTNHASCPVLVVPPSAAANELDPHTWLRRWALRRAIPRDPSELIDQATSR